MAHTKAAGSTRLGRESASKRLGLKKTQGEFVHPGVVLVRQRGTKYLPGKNVRRGGDDTLYATREGVIAFTTKRKRRFDGSRRKATVLSVIPQSHEAVLPRQG